MEIKNKATEKSIDIVKVLEQHSAEHCEFVRKQKILQFLENTESSSFSYKEITDKIGEMREFRSITKDDLVQLFENNKVYTPEEDIERLQRMYGKDGGIDMKALIQDFKKLNEEQYSNYSSAQSRAFFKMFNC